MISTLYFKTNYQLILFSFIFTLVMIFSSFAQSGKLTGIVTDDRTNEALIGANILISGTKKGAVTNINGRFIILNLPAKTYDVEISLIGYAIANIKNVEVNVDRTTELNIRLKEKSIQVEQVVITAERPKIIKDQTSTSNTISDVQISNAPIEGLRGALDFSSSFQKTETGNFSVRGSRSYELNFQINGIEQINSATSAPGSFGTEKANNSWKYDVNPLGVQQLQLISGGFSAEYGNAQAGVVKVVMKEGSPKFNADFKVEYRPSGKYHWGTYLYDAEQNFEWRNWGPIENWFADKNSIIQQLKLDLRYKWLYDKVQFGTATPEEQNLWNEIVSKEITWAHNVWVKNHSPSDDNPLGVYDYRQYAYVRYMFAFGGPLGKDPNILKFYFSGEYKKSPTRLPTAEKNQIYQNYLLNITYFPIQNHKLKSLIGFQKYVGGIWSGSEDIRWAGIPFVPGSLSNKYYVLTDPIRTEQTWTQSLNWTYTINENSFLESTFSHQSENYELPYQYLPGYGQERDRLDSLNDPQGTILLPSTKWWESTYYKAPDAVSTLYYQDTRTENFSLSIDYTNQIVTTNLLKAGFKISYWDMFNNGVNSSFQANSLVARSGIAEYYKAYPINVAFYFQDKMEYSGMIANIGLRAEAFNFQTQVPLDKFNLFYPGKSGPQLGNPETISSKTYFILLPRIGVSFPVGEATAFRIQYGHFASMPIFSHALSRRTYSGWSGFGNSNLESKKTIQYEFGLQQVIEDNNRLDVALYYNDRVTQIGLQRIASYTGSSQNDPAAYTFANQPLYSYTTFANNAFGATIGLEITFENINYQNWSYRLSYNLSQTTEGNYGAEYIYPDEVRNFETRNFTGEFLSSSDRTHNFRGLIQYFVKENEGLELFGIKIFENTIFGLSYLAQSGLPFTYRTTFDLKDIVNNRRYPIETSFDFNFQKIFVLYGNRISFGIRVMNLFDNQWLTPISGETDRVNWVENGIPIDDPSNNNPASPSYKSFVTGSFKTFRNIPRQIFFSLGISL